MTPPSAAGGDAAPHRPAAPAAGIRRAVPPGPPRRRPGPRHDPEFLATRPAAAAEWRLGRLWPEFLATRAGRGAECCVTRGRDLASGVSTPASRAPSENDTNCAGALVQANRGLAHQLTIAGVPVGEELIADARRASTSSERGSIVRVIATDLPASADQLARLARRGALGLARTGAVSGPFSGDFAIAFSTAPAPAGRSDAQPLEGGLEPCRSQRLTAPGSATYSQRSSTALRRPSSTPYSPHAPPPAPIDRPCPHCPPTRCWQSSGVMGDWCRRDNTRPDVIHRRSGTAASRSSMLPDMIVRMCSVTCSGGQSHQARASRRMMSWSLNRRRMTPAGLPPAMA